MRHLSPALLLRLGLGFTFLYAGISGLVNPADWVGFLPAWIGNIVAVKIVLLLFSSTEVVLALWLFVGWQLRWAAGMAALLLLGILVTSSNLLIITFRDIGLLFAALALFVLGGGENYIEKT